MTFSAVHAFASALSLAAMLAGAGSVAAAAAADATWPHDGKYGHGTRHLRIRNQLARDLWVEVQSGGSQELKSDGFTLKPGKDTLYEVPNVWRASRIWGRFDRAVYGPATLLECSLGKRDWYDISLVDGYNLPVTVTPVPGTFAKSDSTDPFQCGTISCREDLLSSCPEELRKTDALGLPTQCLSACSKWNQDEYCCRGAFNADSTCTPDTWVRDYPKLFKAACPTAVTYAFDDSSDTFICPSGPDGIGPDYDIGFGEVRTAPHPDGLSGEARMFEPLLSREIPPGTWRGPNGRRPGPYDTRGRTLLPAFALPIPRQ